MELLLFFPATVPQIKFDAAVLHQHKKRQEEKMFDGGHGKIDAWRVENFKLVPQPKELHGTFFGGDCYVILYTYQKEKREYYLIYYWLVSLSLSIWRFMGPHGKMRSSESLIKYFV